jgi:hypothetical protein
MPRALVGTNVLEEHTVSIFCAEVDTMFIRNVDIYLQVHTALQPRRPNKKTLHSSEIFVSHIPII